MIGFLRGKILNKKNNFIILENNNVGYKIFVNSIIFSEIKIGQQVELYIHQYIREDALDLYGFDSLEALELFELLLSISGVGPKGALGVLTLANIKEIKNSIYHGDAELLTKVSGIGKKTAERIVLELKEKIKKISDETYLEECAKDGTANGYEIDALMTFGYSAQQARNVLCKINPKITDSGKRIKEALKLINNS